MSSTRSCGAFYHDTFFGVTGFSFKPYGNFALYPLGGTFPTHRTVEGWNFHACLARQASMAIKYVTDHL